MIDRTILIGFGEVGQAHFKNLARVYPGKIFYKDKGEQIFDSNGKEWAYDGMGFDLMLIATQCDPNNMEPFYKMVGEYDAKFNPMYVDILTTTPCGACEELEEYCHAIITKSTIRGMHPYLDKFLRDIPKHIGGPSADVMKGYYDRAGIDCVTHAKARATELFHVLNNSDYGVAIMKAKENYDLCRAYGISYMEWLKYKQTNNDGFIKAGYPDKVSPILTPPDGRIGGHCVCYSATTIPTDKRGPLMDMLSSYNERHNAPIKSDTN